MVIRREELLLRDLPGPWCQVRRTPQIPNFRREECAARRSIARTSAAASAVTSPTFVPTGRSIAEQVVDLLETPYVRGGFGIHRLAQICVRGVELGQGRRCPCVPLPLVALGAQLATEAPIFGGGGTTPGSMAFVFRLMPCGTFRPAAPATLPAVAGASTLVRGTFAPPLAAGRLRARAAVYRRSFSWSRSLAPGRPFFVPRPVFANRTILA